MTDIQTPADPSAYLTICARGDSGAVDCVTVTGPDGVPLVIATDEDATRLLRLAADEEHGEPGGMPSQRAIATAALRDLGIPILGEQDEDAIDPEDRAAMALFVVGARVRLRAPLSVFQLGDFPARAAGTVVQVTPPDETSQHAEFALVRLDDHAPDLEEWDNCLQVFLRDSEITPRAFEAHDDEDDTSHERETFVPHPDAWRDVPLRVVVNDCHPGDTTLAGRFHDDNMWEEGTNARVIALARGEVDEVRLGGGAAPLVVLTRVPAAEIIKVPGGYAVRATSMPDNPFDGRGARGAAPHRPWVEIRNKPHLVKALHLAGRAASMEQAGLRWFALSDETRAEISEAADALDALLAAAREAEAFMAGFEGDEAQDPPVDDRLAALRAAIAQAEGGAS